MIVAVEGAAKSVSTMYRAGPAHFYSQGAASLNRAWMLGMGPAEPSGVDYIGAFLPRAHLLLGLLI